MTHDFPGPSHSKLDELNEVTKPHGVFTTLTGESTSAVDEQGNVSHVEGPDRFRLVLGAENRPYLDPDSGSSIFTEARIRELFG